TGTTGTTGGILFDQYAANDYKFAALDFQGQKVIIGHVDPRHGWVVDASFAKTLAANTDYVLNLTMRGASVTVTLSGAVLGTWSFNGVVVDGKFGLLTRNGTTSFDNVRIRTNDPAFNGPANQLAANPTAARPAPGAALDETTLTVFVEEASRRWRATGLTPEQAAALESAHVAIADLANPILGQVHEHTVYIDVDAAGFGWFIDATPRDDGEFPIQVAPTELRAAAGETSGRVGLLGLVMHELGHGLRYAR